MNRQVAKHCFNYLSNFGVDANLVNLHSSKSWPVVCYEDGGRVAKHNHPNSHLSVVFYLQSDLDGGGELFVYPNTDSPTQTILMNSFIPETHAKVHNCYYFEPIVNQMIILYGMAIIACRILNRSIDLFIMQSSWHREATYTIVECSKIIPRKVRALFRTIYPARISIRLRFKN